MLKRILFAILLIFALSYRVYASSAQAAYVSSSAEAVKSNYETGNDDNAAIGDVSDTEYWSAIKVVLGSPIICSGLSIYFNVKVGSPTDDVTLRLETDSSDEPSGTLVHANATGTVTPTDNSWKKTSYTAFTLAAGTYWIVASVPDQSTNYRYTWARDNNGGLRTGYSNDAGASWTLDDVWAFYYRIYGMCLQCYSESTIKQQGSYSLKGVAVQTDSLNDTLTRTVSPTIDLTGKTSIKYGIYSASRTGSNVKIGIHDSGGTTTEHTANISSTGAWEAQTWDISGVSNANKDAIDSIVITVVNADAANTFYIDNMYGNLPVSSGGNMELYTDYFQIGLASTTVRGIVFANKAPNSVKLTRTGTGTTLTDGVLNDSDIESAGLYSFYYSADVSGESSDTCIRAMISTSDSTIWIYGLSLLGLE